MPTIPDGYAQVLVPFAPNFDSRVSVVTFGVKNNLVLTEPADIAEAVWPSINDNLVPVCDEDVLVGPLHVEANFGAGVVGGDGTSSAAGGADIVTPPSQVAVLVSKGTGAPGRANRGRFYWPWFVADTAVDQAGRIDPGYVAGHQALFDSFLSDLESADVPMCILHTGAGSPALVNTLTVRPKVATQRRRLGR